MWNLNHIRWMHSHNKNSVLLLRRKAQRQSSRRSKSTATNLSSTKEQITGTSITMKSNVTIHSIPKSSSKLQTAVKYAVGGTIVTSIASMGYVYNQVGDTEGLMRSLSFYKLAIPTYVKYRLLQMRKAPDEEWDDLDKLASVEGLEKILELQGFYIKCGQMAAANIGNAFPKVWQSTMSILQDNCPSRPFNEVKEIISAEYGSETAMEEIFERFDPIPIGSASIGQVHRAKLRASGKEVVVKIQYPDVERLFRGDVRTLIMFCKLAQPVHVPALEEIEHQFMTEFDYRAEAQQLEQVRSNMMQAGFNKYCEVPNAHPDLCTRRVLIMDYIPGDKLVVGLQKDAEKLASFMSTSTNSTSINSSRSSPNAQEYEYFLRFINMQRYIYNAKVAFYNCTVAWWLPGGTYMSYQTKDVLPNINHAKLIDTILHLHGHQVLVDGYFNGDPHPGNLLLVNKPNNTQKQRIGLIDFGQVKQLTKPQRLLLCKLIIALANDDKQRIVDLMVESGFRTKHMNPEVLYLYSKVSFDEDNSEITKGLHIQEFMEHLDATDPVEELVKEYVMVSRVSIILRGLAHAIGQARSVAKVWKPIAEKVLKREEKDY